MVAIAAPYQDWKLVSKIAATFLIYPFVCLVFYKEIRFSDHIVFKRFLYPQKVEEYSDVKDVGKLGFQVRWYHVSWLPMENGSELEAIVKDLIRKGYIEKDQLTNSLEIRERAAARAIIPGLLLGVFTLLVLEETGLNPLEMDTKIVFLVLFIPWYIVSYFAAKSIYVRKR